ncbi:class F sortase [bacterium]|jgi:LPXTG-site transpeptidase (sortase) family protein|nr:MAG: class F sortase [bacterium]
MNIRKVGTLLGSKKIIVGGVVCLILLAGLFHYRSESSFVDSGGVVTYSTENPDEKKPTDNFQWKGGVEDPKKIIISSIGVDAFIQKVGVDQNKEVAVPSNVHMVGWFVDTVRPGQKGLSLIDGHVSGRKNDGVFKDLEKLNEGDQFLVQLGNDSEVKYRVIGKRSAPVADSVSIMFSQNPKVSSQLNLVTCSGRYDEKTRSYDERLTVMAERI